MAHRLTALLLAFATIFAPLPATATPAEPLAEGLEVVVAGTPRPRYAHAGRWYVEALNGREYAIRIRNPFGVRVAVALSVDGLNTIDAQHTPAASARKWVLEPYQTVTISGWQTSRTEARRFTFTTEARSYGQALGMTANLGVISAVFYREHVHPAVIDERNLSQRRPRSLPDTALPSPAPAPSAAAPRAESAGAAADQSAAANELAATGMGRATEHVVTQVRLDLEEMPARTVNIRYEFRPQLVALGILRDTSRLHQRERAEGFDERFSPVR